VLAAVVALALAAPAAQAKVRPFALVETGTATFNGPYVTSHGTGVATHLGRFTLDREAELSDPQGTVFQVTGRATIVAADGDRLFASITGTLDTATSRGRLVYQWEGGTGRFHDARGRTIWHVKVAPDGSYSVVAYGVIDF